MKSLIKKISFPFQWIFAKIGKGLRFLHDNFEEISLVTLPNFFFRLVGLYIVTHNLTDIKKDTTSLTNYGFAILVGIASVCFSWIRGLDVNKEPKMILRISLAGENSLHCAIIFLLASALKYASLHLEIVLPKNWTIAYGTINVILYIIYLSCFVAGFYKVGNVLGDINKVLYERLYEGERN